MADSARINAWIIANAKALGLTFQENTWIQEFYPNLTDITAAYSTNLSHPIFGRGVGTSPELALEIATTELIERYVLFENKMPSSGAAAHIQESVARENAKRELLERDLFFSHFLTKTPFSPLEKTFEEAQPAAAWLKPKNISLQLFQLGKSGVLALVDGRKAERPFGFIISTAIKSSIKEAVLRATISCFRRAHQFVTEGKPSKISETQFLQLPSPDYFDHGCLALDPHYSQKISFLFRPSVQRNDLTMEDPEIRFETLSCKNPFFNSSGLFVVRAFSQNLQSAYCGIPTERKINYIRLRKILPNISSLADLETAPHPYA